MCQCLDLRSVISHTTVDSVVCVCVCVCVREKCVFSLDIFRSQKLSSSCYGNTKIMLIQIMQTRGLQ